jgi:hypothetical protein
LLQSHKAGCLSWSSVYAEILKKKKKKKKKTKKGVLSPKGLPTSHWPCLAAREAENIKIRFPFLLLEERK